MAERVIVSAVAACSAIAMEQHGEAVFVAVFSTLIDLFLAARQSGYDAAVWGDITELEREAIERLRAVATGEKKLDEGALACAMFIGISGCLDVTGRTDDAQAALAAVLLALPADSEDSSPVCRILLSSLLQVSQLSRQVFEGFFWNIW